MTYELDDLDIELIAKCRSAVQGGHMDDLNEDDYHEAIELLVNITSRTDDRPKWPHRVEYLNDLGFVVWRDVFEGERKCSLDAAVRTHKVAVFVSESEADAWCEYRNATPDLW